MADPNHDESTVESDGTPEHTSADNGEEVPIEEADAPGSAVADRDHDGDVPDPNEPG